MLAGRNLGLRLKNDELYGLLGQLDPNNSGWVVYGDVIYDLAATLLQLVVQNALEVFCVCLCVYVHVCACVYVCVCMRVCTFVCACGLLSVHVVLCSTRTFVFHVSMILCVCGSIQHVLLEW